MASGSNSAKGAHVWSKTRAASQQARRPKRDALKKARHAAQLAREKANKAGLMDDYRYVTPWAQAKAVRAERRAKARAKAA
ncbi:MAG: hypothetical protein ACXVYY_01220 [Oryzihumus sp.]